MNLALAVLFVLIPYGILASAFVFEVGVRRRARALLRHARWLGPAGAFLLVAGDAYNGFDRADGFDARLFWLGATIVAAIQVLLFVRPVQGWLRARLQDSVVAVREDFREPAGGSIGPRRRAISAALFVAFCGVFYLFYTTYGAFNFQLKYFVFDFLDLIQDTAEKVPVRDFFSADTCVSTRLYRVLPAVLYPFISQVTPALYYHVCIAMIGCIFAIRWAAESRRSPWVLFASHLFYLAVSLNPDLEYNRTGYFELTFALLYLVGLLVLLHARATAAWCVALGLTAGVAFAQKELAALLLGLIAYRLATWDLPPRRLLTLTGWVALGFTPPSAVLFVWLLRCGATEGVYHLPVLWYRGIVLQTQWTHLDVKTAIDTGQVFSFFEMFARRASLQTVGEWAVGAASLFGAYALTGVFPVAYLVANLPAPQVRVIGVYLGLGALMYGITFWKGGDSSDPLYTMLPFGYVFAAPYLIRLVKRSFDVLRTQRRLSLRTLYIPVLLVFNLWFLARLLPPVVQTARDLRHLSGVSRNGLTFSVEPRRSERELRDLLMRLEQDGELGRWLFLSGCIPAEVPRSIVHSPLERRLALLDVRYEILPVLQRMDVDRIRQAFRIITHLWSYRLQDVHRIFVLACVQPFEPERPLGPFASPGPWLGGCVQVVWSDPRDLGMILFAFELDRCRRYLPEDLLDRGVEFGRYPRLPVTPDPVR